MATVYLAEDLKHSRSVAVKVLKPELAAVLGGERFVAEIRTTAALQHPHILPLFDSGGADGFLYYVMPFVEGETLRSRLSRERRLSLLDAVTITKTIAGALDAAHRKGIIHRDIKPENILLQDEVAVVADFGIAMAVTSAGGERLTETGLSIGTPAYMSPEQVVGERDLDARSDVYALACVAYEMLAGDPPFVASSPQAVMAKHVMDVPPPVTTTRPEVTPPMAKALARALSKAPADRYDSAGAFAAGLTAEDPGADTGPRSLVVLPFANQSPDPDNEYFVDGLTEEIIADLSRLRGLRVISRNSAMTLKRSTKDTPTIARELKVSHVLTGSVRRAGNALRVTAELVHAATDTPVWSDRYSGTVEDVFGIQEEIARKIVSALEVKLSETERAERPQRPIEDPVAYDCYLRARQEMYGWTPESCVRAMRLVDEALAIVGDAPLLLAMKAQLQWSEVNTLRVPAEVGLVRAEELVSRALALDPDFPLAIFVRGLVAGNRGQVERALADLYRAHELWPGDANILVELCRFSNTAGLRGYRAMVDAAVQIDPLTPVSWLVVSTYSALAGRHAEVLPAARRAIEMAPDPSMLHLLSAWWIAQAGLPAEACGVLARVGSAMGETPGGWWARFLKAALEGETQKALAFITPEFEQALRRNEFAALAVGEGFALLGRTEEALPWLRAAIDRGFINYPYFIEHDPFLRTIRDDPRFVELMNEAKPRWEAAVQWEAGRAAVWSR
jgi:serine/threonine protein kinase/tetratricopeptide (TPR) repeat protein